MIKSNSLRRVQTRHVGAVVGGASVASARNHRRLETLS